MKIHSVRSALPFNLRRPRLRKLLPTFMAACAGAFCMSAALANPAGESIVSGQVTFSRQGNVFTVTNSPNAIVNWTSFSISAGEMLNFIQQNSSSSVLNRVTGGDPSQILGTMQSNGRVFLVNPNGIVFGAGSQVNVTGLVASTLNISNADFLAGKNNFSAGSIAGNVDNQGAITTPSGGQVFLIAPNVGNTGIITSPEGEVLLAAGHSVQLADSTNPSLQVTVSSPTDQAINLGQVIAQGGKIGIYGALVNQRGTLNANSATVGESGKIVLRASRATLLEAGSVTTATGIDGGGEIQALGEQVGLQGNARVDASGQNGGGTVLIGGDYQGKNAAIVNALRTSIDKDASIAADAIVRGNGGKVIVWGDDSTEAYGSISVRGGAQSGNGGFVETSGHALSAAGIRVNAGAAHGKAGTWLLDPFNIVVNSNDPGTVGQTTTVNAGDLFNASANIVLQADNDISFNTPVTVNASGLDLKADAGRNINVGAALINSGGSIHFVAGGAIMQNAAITAQSLDAQGATVTLTNAGNMVGNVSGQATAGDFSYTSATSMAVAGTGISASGDINLKSSADGMTINQASGALLTANNLNLDTDGDVNLSENNNVRGLTAVHSGSGFNDIILNNTGSLTLGGVGSGSGGGIAAGSRLAVATTGALSVKQPVTGLVVQLTGASLDVGNSVNPERATITAPQVDLVATGGTLSMAAGAVVSGTTLSFTADQMALDASAQITTHSSGESLGSVRFSAQTGSTVTALGAGATDSGTTLGLSAAELGIVTTNKLTIGNPLNGGAINVVGALDLATPGKVANVEIVNDGDINIGAAFKVAQGLTLNAGAGSGKIASLNGATVTANTLLLRAGGGIGSAVAPLLTQVTAIETMVEGTGAINIRNNVGTPGLLTLRHIDSTGAVSIENTGETTVTDSGNEPGVTGAGNVSLIAHSPLNINSAVTSTNGNVYLEAGSTGSPNDNLTFGSGGSVTAGGNITLAAGNNIVVDPTQLSNTNGGGVTQTPSLNSVPTLSACIANPALAGCSAILPGLSACIANPATAGCSVVLPILGSCIANPAAPGCSVVLPSLGSCIVNPAVPGCAVVLPSLRSCIVNPTAAGCTVVLPGLGSCIANPTAPGCSVVLPSLNFCVANPTAAGCAAVLPNLAQCTANPTAAGCSAVLPTLASCTANPAQAGCSAVLPAVSQCERDSSLPGCSVVLPPTADICSIAPNSALCQVLSPGTSSQPVKPVQQASNEIIKTVTTSTPKTDFDQAAFLDTKKSTASEGGSGGGATGSTATSTTPDDSKSDKTADKADTKEAAANDKSGTKNEPTKKTYCN